MNHTGFAPTHGLCISQSTLLSLQVALQGNFPKQALDLCTSQVALVVMNYLPVFCALPGSSSSGDQVLVQHTVPVGRCILIAYPVQATKFPGCAVRVPSQAPQNVCRLILCLYYLEKQQLSVDGIWQ